MYQYILYAQRVIEYFMYNINKTKIIFNNNGSSSKCLNVKKLFREMLYKI